MFTLSGISSGPGGEICRDKSPNISLSVVNGKWSGGSLGSEEKDLVFKHTAKIARTSDCAELAISDSEECTAYVIYSKLVQLTKTQLTPMKFTIIVPPMSTAYKGLVVKLTTAKVAFEEWQS